jgi:hypothetical protein
VEAVAATKLDSLAQAREMVVMGQLHQQQPRQILAAVVVVRLIQVDSQQLQVVQEL